MVIPLLVSAAMLMQSPAASTADGPRGYGFASVTFAYHPASDVHYRDVTFPVGGSGLDLGGGGGAFVFQRVLGVEGEFLYGGTVSTAQYTFYDENAHDILLSALVRYQPDRGRLALIAGGGRAWTRTWQDPAQSNRPPLWRQEATVTFGADVTAGNARRAVLAGSFRVRWVNRDLYYGDGFGKITYQLGATLFLR